MGQSSTVSQRSRELSLQRLLDSNTTHDVLAVATRSTSTFVLGDLEHALLSSAAGDRGVARRLLHGDRGNEDGRDAVLLGDLVELVDVGSTGLEGRVALSDDLSEIGVLKLAEGDDWERERGKTVSAISSVVLELPPLPASQPWDTQKVKTNTTRR